MSRGAVALIACFICLVAAPPALADWTGDGVGDVLGVDTSGSMRVYRGSGTGLFVDAGERIDGSGHAWNSAADIFSGGDFDGDGEPDVFTRTADGSLRVYSGNGAGGFTDDGTLIGGGWGGFTTVIAPGDFTGDGDADVLAVAPNGGLWLYRGNGVGGFVDNGLLISTGWNSFTGIYAAGDFSGDGNPDVFARTSTGGLRLYRGNGLGGFIDNGTQPGGGWNAFDVILGTGDFTGDGKADVLARTTSGSFMVYRGNGAGSFADNGTVIGGGWGAFTAIAAPGDFSGDGHPDVLARLSDGSLRMLRGNGLGGLIDNGEPAGGGWDTAVDVLSPGDFTGDGKPDLLSRTPDGRLRVHRGDGAGGFSQSGTLVSTGWGGLTALVSPGDFSGDGKPDVLARMPDGAMRLYRGNGAGGFIDNGIQVGAQWQNFVDIQPAGDFDQDGDADIFARSPGGQLYLYRGNGVGSFADNGTLIGNYWGTDNFTAFISGGDFDGNAIPDVLARTPSGAMRLYSGNGLGGFVDNGRQIGAQWNAFRLIVLASGPVIEGTIFEDGEWVEGGDGGAPEDGVNPDGSRYPVASAAGPPDQKPDINLGACNDGKKIYPTLPPGFLRTSRVTLQHLKSKTVDGVVYVKIQIEARTNEAWENIARWAGVGWQIPNGGDRRPGTNARYAFRTSTERDIEGGRVPKPWYFHTSAWVRRGGLLRFRAKVRHEPVTVFRTSNVTVTSTGANYPRRDPSRFYRCIVP